MQIKRKTVNKVSRIVKASEQERQLRTTKSRILGLSGQISNATLAQTLENLRKSTTSQASKFWPMMQKTFQEVSSFIPEQALKVAMQKRNISSVKELALDVFGKTVFLPRPVYNELISHRNDLKNAKAFYFNGHAVIPVDKGRLGETVIFPVVHEWIHAFDAHNNFTRTTITTEGLAFGIDLFVQKKVGHISINPQRISKDSEKEYLIGFNLGKKIASTATELHAKKGDYAPARLFKTLFALPDFDFTTIEEIKRMLLQN